MSADDSFDDDASPTLDELAQAKSDAIERCHYRTACRLAAEIKRIARAERQLQPYLWALHTLTNHATDLLDPEQGREAAIELIAVLESEERARQIQPDIDAGEYEWMVSQVSSCAYDNLGKATALSRGYNSEGLHDAIAEGIQVCRRTGKLECIHCFREYADEVFLAADDLQMALHHARHVVENSNVREGFDRRWSGASDETRILLVAGQLDAAETAARRAWELADTYHNRLDARLTTALDLETIRLLKGSPAAEAPPAEAAAAPPADEFPEHQLRRDLLDALRASTQGDHAAAIETLTAWDRRLTERRCLRFWFEVRLRLIAAYRLSGDDRRAEALARPLEARAREARDWTTLRRLSRLLDPNATPSPIAPAGPLIVAAGHPSEAGSAANPQGTPEQDGPESPEPTPLGETLETLARALEDELNADEPRDPVAIRESLLSLGPDAATHPSDVARLLKLATYVAGDPSQALPIWEWAEAIAAPFPQNPLVLNLLAALGDGLRLADDSQVADRIDARRIESLFRQSLDLDPNNAANFGRAAVHHDNAGRVNETERCLARLHRLDRGNARAALWLSQIYRESDRAHDALAVLDMALRAADDVPEVAWQAGILAHALKQYEALLTYLDRFESLVPDQPWTNYYRASGLLWLKRPTEAIAALDEEARHSETPLFHVLILRACAAADLKKPDDLRTLLGAVLEVRFADVRDLTHAGLVNLLERLWDATTVLPADDPLRAALEDRLLATGLAPDSLFQGPRLATPTVEGINLYVCTLYQPLDADWGDSAGCLAREEDWTAYRITWCVLARDEAAAGRTALAWQARCYPREATVEEIQLRDEGYTDHPGVIWQGMRQAED